MVNQLNQNFTRKTLQIVQRRLACLSITGAMRSCPVADPATGHERIPASFILVAAQLRVSIMVKKKNIQGDMTGPKRMVGKPGQENMDLKQRYIKLSEANPPFLSAQQ